LKERPLSQLANDVIPYIVAKGCPVPQDKSWLERMVKTLRERSKTLVELVDSATFYLTDDISIDEKAAKKFLTPQVRGPIAKLIERLTALDDFAEANIEQTFSAVLQEMGLSMGELAQPVRVALTGSTVSPGIHEVIAVLGKERTLRRLSSALQSLQSPPRLT
jgi:glutamyl-tRNA synthetase